MLNNKKIFIIVLITALLGSVVFGFPAIAQEIRIGVLLPLNGKLAIIGDLEKKAVELAQEQINTSQEVTTNQEIVLMFEDSMGEPETAKQAMDQLIDEGVSAVIGGCSSSATFAAAAVAEDKGIPFLITTASADRITEMDMKYIFRLCLPSSEQTKTIAALLNRRKGLRRAAILREKSRFGEYETRKILKVCRRARILITDIVSYATSEKPDDAAYFRRLQEVAPDLLFVFSKDLEATRILALCEVMELPPKLIVAKGKPFLNPLTFLEAQVARKNIYTISLWHPSAPYPGVGEFIKAFSDKYGIEADYHAAQAYAAMQVINDAVSRALSPEPADIKEALEQTEMMTVYGPVTFQSYGDKDRQNRPSPLLLEWQGGQLKPVQY